MSMAIFKSWIKADVGCHLHCLVHRIGIKDRPGKQECLSFCIGRSENPPMGKENRCRDLQTWSEEFVVKTVNVFCMQPSQSTPRHPVGRGRPDILNFKSGFHAAQDERVRKLHFFFSERIWTMLCKKKFAERGQAFNQLKHGRMGHMLVVWDRSRRWDSENITSISCSEKAN